MNELRIVYFTDPHVRGSSPRARRDNYFEVIIGKLAWVVTYANGLLADGPALLVCGGDLFDGPDAAYSVTAAVAVVLQKSRCPVLAVAGNHDLYGYNPETLGRTPLGLLARLDIVKLLSIRDGYYLPDYSVRITGRGFDWDIDKSPRDYAQPPGSPPAAIRIHVVHGMAVEQPLPAGVRHTLLQEVPGTDIVLTGHEHIGYGHKMHGRTSWINPGALGRLSARIEEMTRQPRIAVLTIDPVGDPKFPPIMDISLVDVPAKPGNEVLSRDELHEAAARSECLAEFIGLLKAEANLGLIDAEAMIGLLAENKGFAEGVAAEAKRRLIQARNDLQGRRS